MVEILGTIGQSDQVDFVMPGQAFEEMERPDLVTFVRRIGNAVTSEKDPHLIRALR